MVSNEDLETICRRIAKQVERSWSILYTVCDRLNKQPFEGSQHNGGHGRSIDAKRGRSSSQRWCFNSRLPPRRNSDFQHASHQRT